MPIKIDWLDSNVTVTGFRVYRAETPIPESPLPTPIAEVGPAIKTYTDNDVVRGKLYYYRIGTVVGTEETLSSNAAKAFVPDTGPGPQTIKRGDWKCGYFGRFPIGQLLTPAEMRQVCSYPVTGTVVDTAVEWLKFAYNGKVLFFPDQELATLAAWTELYALGLVFGDIPSAQWSSVVKTTYGTVPQNKRIVRDDWEFIVRLPRIRHLDQFTASDTTDSIYTGEWDNLIGLAYTGRTLPATKPTINTNNVDDLNTQGRYFMTADHTSATGFLARGGGSFDGQVQYTYTGGSVSYTNWRPVLELVP